MSKKRVLILIPARFASTRFPGKPLVSILGKSMIQRVFENCSISHHQDFLFETYVVTDDEKIENHVKTFSSNVVRVDDDVSSGTLRIHLAFKRFFSELAYDLVINVQGDEPLLKRSELTALAQFHLSSTFDIGTLVKKHQNFDSSFLDSNKVKVVMNENSGAVFYFSRAGIPYKRGASTDADNDNNDYWFLHIGVYSYNPKALLLFANATESRLENLEKLEQLRALEIGLSIGAFPITSQIFGVDVPEDVKKVETALLSTNKEI